MVQEQKDQDSKDVQSMGALFAVPIFRDPKLNRGLCNSGAKQGDEMYSLQNSQVRQNFCIVGRPKDQENDGKRPYTHQILMTLQLHKWNHRHGGPQVQACRRFRPWPLVDLTGPPQRLLGEEQLGEGDESEFSFWHFKHRPTSNGSDGENSASLVGEC